MTLAYRRSMWPIMKSIRDILQNKVHPTPQLIYFMVLVFFFNLYFWIISNISSSTFAEPALSRTAMWHVICVQHSTRPWSFPFRTLKQLQQLHSNNCTKQCTRRCTTNIYYKHKNNTGSKFQCCYLFGFVSFKCSFWKFELWRRYFWAAYSSPGGATLFVPILKWQSLAKMKGRYRAARAAKKRHQRCM